MNACSQKEIALGWLQLPSIKPRDEEQSGGGIKMGDETELFRVVQATPDQAHTRIKLKGLRPCGLRTMAEKAVRPLSGLRSSGIS